MREKLRDRERLIHMVESIDNIFEFVHGKTFGGYKADKILRFAVIKNLEIIGEAAYLLSQEFRQKHNDIAWNDMIGMRHVLVHGYYQIKDEIVWATIDTELKPLKEKIIQLLQTE